MAAGRGNDPDSRPISVAELMARARQEGDDESAVPPQQESRGRRRGGPGSVSVSELTGDIPRVTEPIAADPVDRRDEAPEAPRPVDDNDTNVIGRVRDDHGHEGVDTGDDRDLDAADDADADRDESEGKRRGGFLGRLRRKKDTRDDDSDEDRRGDADSADSGAEVGRPMAGSLGARDLTEQPTADAGAERSNDDTQVFPGAHKASADETAVHDTSAIADTPPSDRAWSAVAPASREFHRVERTSEDADTREQAAASDADNDRGARRSDADRADDTDGIGVVDRDDDDRESDDDADRDRTTPSPVMQWLSLCAQVIVGLLIGAGLFWGFTQLWKWNEYFALVLAVVVIFGLVTLVHVVRRSQDLLSTLLALGVGLIVTIGPLVLLGTGG